MGVNHAVSKVSLNGMAISNGANYDATSKRLTISGLEKMTSMGAWSSDWVLLY